MRKKLGKLLAGIMLLNSLIAAAPVQTVYAADPVPITVNLDRGLQFSPTSTVPQMIYNGIPTDMAFMSWELAAGRADNLVLQHMIDDNKRVTLTVSSSLSKVATVYYDMEVWDSVTRNWVKANSAEYGVYSNKNAAGLENIVPIKTFLNSGYNSDDPGYQVLTADARTGVSYIGPNYQNGTDNITPMFTVRPEQGFLFAYNNVKAYFVWGPDGKFYYATQGVKGGNLYDFTLYNADTAFPPLYANLGIYPNNSITVNTGFDLKNAKVIPTAENDTKTVADVLNMNLHPRPIPGTDVGLRLNIPMPKVWDTTNGGFVALTTAGALFSKPLEMELRLNNVDASKSIQIRNSNILHATNAQLPNTTINSGSGAQCTISRNDTTNMLNVVITKLSPGYIYDESSIVILATSDIKTKKSVFPKYSVFTFPKYNIVEESGLSYARVEPYAKMPGYFMLKEGSGANNLSPSVIQKTDGVTPLMLPLTVNSQNLWHSFYQLFFSPEKNFVNNSTDNLPYSQIIEYQATANTLTIGTPKRFEVVNATLLPLATSLKGEKGELTMDLRWSMGSVDMIGQMLDALEANVGPGTPLVAIYQVNYALSPEEKSPKSFAWVKATITRDALNNYVVQYEDVAPTRAQVVNPGVSVPLLPKPDPLITNGRFDMEVSLKVPAEAAATSVGGVDYKYPNIYFLNVQPTQQSNLISGDLTPLSPGTSPALYDSMTLSDISKLEVPPPHNLTLDFSDIAAPKDQVSFRARWNIPGPAVKDYFQHSYGLTDTPAMRMTLYISQNGDYMSNSFPKLNYKQALKPEDAVLERQKASVNVALPTGEKTMIFSDINGNQVNLTGLALASGTPRDALREGKTVAVAIELTSPQMVSLRNDGTSVLADYVLDGLDKNQKYYVYVDFFVEQSNGLPKNDPLYVWIADESKLSNLAAIITKGEPQVPDGEDRVPPAPANLDKKDVGLDTATIFWDRVPAISATEAIEYEIIRVKDNSIADEFLDSRLPFSEMWQKGLPANSDKLGFRSEGGKLYPYADTAFSTTEVDKAKYIYDDSDAKIVALKDNTLRANQLYFYYVRTVKKVVKNGVVTSEQYSTWSAVTVTTTPVKGPKNLKIELGRTDYDPLTQVYISFDAPIQFGMLSSVLGVNYNLQYQLKKEGEDWQSPVVMPASSLIPLATSSKEEGYTHFLFKISGLTPSTGYSVRVCNVDIASGDTSLYSNIATFRTDFNQEDYEKDNTIKDWEDFLSEELDKLTKNPYWTGANNPGLFEVIYRPGMLESALSVNKDGQYRLPESKAAQTVYYIPADAYAAASNAGIGFSISHGNMGALIPPGAIDLNNNPAMLALGKKLKDKTFEGYFVRISIGWRNAPQTVEGNNTISQVAEVRLDLVGTNDTLKNWDKKTYDDVKKELADFANDGDIKDDLLDMLDDEKTSEDISRQVLSWIDKAQLELFSVVHENLMDVVEGTLAVPTVDKAIAIIAKGVNNSTTVSAYQYENGQWVVQEVVQLGEDKAVYARKLGAYVFTGRVINIPGLDKNQNAGNITGIVAKYGLDDYLGKETIVMASPATRLMLVGCVARMSGAPKGADPFEWMKTNKGLIIPARDTNSPISNQEALYVLMNLYETKTGTKVATLQIRNYNATANMALDDKYKQSVRAAFELGFYSDTGMDPKAPMTIGEMLRLLGILDTKTKL